MADEKYKVKECRLCLHCGRIVQHMGGCSSMVCGQNYYGGNDQSGCGKNFTWDQAKLFVPVLDRKPEENQNLFVLSVISYENVARCDGCHETVREIRFDCIHCPSLIYCEKCEPKCEPKCTLLPSNQNNKQGKLQHFFQIFMTP